METRPPSPHGLASTWAVLQAAGEARAVVRVKKLQGLVSAAQDAWGRERRTQPALVSVECSFRHGFAATASRDRLAADTAHYGTISKTVLASLEPSPSRAPGLRAVLDAVWCGLTGRLVSGRVGVGVSVGLSEAQGEPERPVLHAESLRFLSVSVCLPKASLLGEGVSLTATSTFGLSDSDPTALVGLTLRLLRLRVPTLIGVNPNERLARQFVLATVEIDKYDFHGDFYASLEKFVVETIESSSFETLEALGIHLAESIRSWPLPDMDMDTSKTAWQIKIRLEKPTAVPLAECPEVEVTIG